MPTTVLQAPTGTTGVVTTEFGNDPIDPTTGQVAVDSRVVLQLLNAGFTLASGSGVSNAQLSAILTSYAKATDVPAAIQAMISSSAPPSETAGGTAGTTTSLASGTHTHPRLSEVLTGTLDSNGNCPIIFTKKYSITPGLTFISMAAGKAVAWDFTFSAAVGGIIPGGTVTGKVASQLPVLTALLTDLLKLSAFNPFNSPASGISFSGLAIRSAADPLTG